MEARTGVIETRLSDGTIIHVQATLLGGEEKVVRRGVPSFEGVTKAIEGIAESVMKTLRKVQPHKASVEFSLEVALESGQLTAFLVKGSSTANLKVTLEWNEGISHNEPEAQS